MSQEDVQTTSVASIGVIVSAILSVAKAYTLWISPTGYTFGIFFLCLYPLCSNFLVVVFLIALLAFFFSKKSRRFAGLVTCFLFAYLVTFYLGTYLARIAQYKGFQALVDQDPVVTAILNFEQKYEHPPTELSDLIPEFLPVIPSELRNTEIYYRYYSEEKVPQEYWPENRWVIEIVADIPFFNNVKFFYLPNQIYSDDHEKLHEWGFYIFN
ncbi:MAG: hypothetical protein GY832_20015 [Chloroflexi bacterium]|nr:hypothetical protein [Chloroflexota bacterium]